MATHAENAWRRTRRLLLRARYLPLYLAGYCSL